MKNEPTESDSLSSLNTIQADIGYGSKNVFVFRIFQKEWYLVYYNRPNLVSGLPGINANLLILDEDDLEYVYYQSEVRVFDFLEQAYGVEKGDITHKDDSPGKFRERMETLEEKFLGG